VIRYGGSTESVSPRWRCAAPPDPRWFGADSSNEPTVLVRGLRDYGVDGQLGLEPTPEEYVAHLVAVFREVRRVLRDDGTCWVNLGDSYAGHDLPGWRAGNEQKNGGVSNRNGVGYVAGLKPKDLVGIPWRVAFALQADGWWLRSDVIWAKPNPMPESITDRPTKAHEYLFLLTKAARYYYDNEGIREPLAETTLSDGRYGRRDELPTVRNVGGRTDGLPRCPGGQGNPNGRNRRTVWTIATEPYPEAHFATFPEKLVEPCILAGTSERGACPTCGAPWEREVERTGMVVDRSERTHPFGRTRTSGTMLEPPKAATLGWSPGCAHEADPVPCRVLDPFAGSGTTVAVAERLGRVGIGCELKPEYLALAKRRTVQAGLL
jgi:DNA modification methylase